MNIHLLPLFIPAMFLVVGIEWLHDKAHGHQHFKFESSIMNICCGLIERIMDVYLFIGLFLWFNYLQTHVGIFDISPTSPVAWLVLMIALDFLIYWYHRGGHTINLLWGAHVTHHQCEEFNLTVAFRNSIFPYMFRGIVLSLLAVAGYGGEMIILALTINGIWQFGIHTTKINKLGILEKFMATPSFHRVHHGSNDIYLDKNFGGMFSVWDRLFGTFQAETEAPVYGLKNPINTNNPLYAYTHVWQDMWKASLRVRRAKDLIKIWFGTPTEFYNEYKLPEHTTATPKIRPSNSLIYYIIWQIVTLNVLLFFTLVFEEFIPPVFRIQTTVLVVLSSISVCMLTKPSKSIFRLELFRLILMALVALFYYATIGIACTFILYTLPIAVIWLLLIQEKIIFD